MMTDQPAFPRPFSIDNTPSSFPSSQLYSAYSGMTLRDYFAAKAMQSILVGIECAPDDVKNVVESAYVLADAMLAARKKK